LFRSTDTSRLADAEVPAVEALGLKTVVDLRTDLERGAAPDRALPGVREVVLDVLADSKDSAPARLPALVSNPAAAKDLLGDGKAVAMFEAGYREFITLPSALTGFRDFLTMVGTSDDVPLLFHCTTGKDRTGWAAASLLTLLGVSRQDVYHDYLLTNEQLVPQLRPRLKPFADAGGDVSLLEPVIGVRTEYLDAAFDEVTTTFGSFEDYLSKGLRIDPAAQQQLRDRLVEQ
jgi:protein-tyrosine phosphatase